MARQDAKKRPLEDLLTPVSQVDRFRREAVTEATLKAIERAFDRAARRLKGSVEWVAQLTFEEVLRSQFPAARWLAGRLTNVDADFAVIQDARVGGFDQEMKRALAQSWAALPWARRSTISWGREWNGSEVHGFLPSITMTVVVAIRRRGHPGLLQWVLPAFPLLPLWWGL